MDRIENYSEHIKNVDVPYRALPFKPPIRMIISGSSGCGKTNLLVHLMLKCLYYEHVIFFSKTLSDEPKYEILREFFQRMRERADREGLQFDYVMCDDVSNLPPFDRNIKRHTLYVFDDAVNEIRESQRFRDYVSRVFSYGRPRGCSIIVITQKIANAVPTFIRENTSHFVIFGRPTGPSITCMTNYLPLEYSELKELIDRNVHSPHDFLLIQKDAPDAEKISLNMSRYVPLREG